MGSLFCELPRSLVLPESPRFALGCSLVPVVTGRESSVRIIFVVCRLSPIMDAELDCIQPHGLGPLLDAGISLENPVKALHETCFYNLTINCIPVIFVGWRLQGMPATFVYAPAASEHLVLKRHWSLMISLYSLLYIHMLDSGLTSKMPSCCPQPVDLVHAKLVMGFVRCHEAVQ